MKIKDQNLPSDKYHRLFSFLQLSVAPPARDIESLSVSLRRNRRVDELRSTKPFWVFHPSLLFSAFSLRINSPPPPPAETHTTRWQNEGNGAIKD